MPTCWKESEAVDSIWMGLALGVLLMCVVVFIMLRVQILIPLRRLKKMTEHMKELEARDLQNQAESVPGMPGEVARAIAADLQCPLLDKDDVYGATFSLYHHLSSPSSSDAGRLVNELSYESLFRLAAALLRDAAARRELFLRACLNVLLHNRDDHLKNVSFLMDARGRWTLAPFYDFTFADGPGGWQTLSVAGEGANPGPDDLLRLAAEVDLPRTDALDAVDRARAARAALPSLCRDLGVPSPRF